MNKLQRRILKGFRDMAPKKGESVTSVQITSSIGGVKETVTLTPETRVKINKILKEDKEHGESGGTN